MMLAVCLITADRPKYTNETLTTLRNHNPNLSRDAILLHADDGSADGSNYYMAKAEGFVTCYRSLTRQGVMPALRVMWRQAIVMGATHILHLENDIRSVAPLPLAKIPQAECVRLYGRFKGANGTYPTGPHHMETKIPIEWTREPGDPHWERATCHWGAQPSITRAGLLHLAIERAECLKDVSRQLSRIDTLRPVWNVTQHIGVNKTTGANFGA